MNLLSNIVFKNFRFFVIVISLTVFYSCVSTNKGFQSSPVIVRNVDLDPITADIDVSTKKVFGESTSKYFKLHAVYFLVPPTVLHIRLKGDRTYIDGIDYSTDIIYPKPLINNLVSKVRSSAAYKALENTNADFLVNPQYSVKISDKWFTKEITVTVSGYPASYKNFRSEEIIKVISENDNIMVIPDDN